MRLVEAAALDAGGCDPLACLGERRLVAITTSVPTASALAWAM